MRKIEEKTFILFNSPDYPNLGDHAIALAENVYFKYFEEYDFIEISCIQYMKENLRIRSAIKKMIFYSLQVVEIQEIVICAFKT